MTEAEEPAKKKNKRERKEERQNIKKTKKFKAQSQQESFKKPKRKKLKREEAEEENEEMPQSDYLKVRKVQRAKLEMNGNGFREEKPGTKANMKKRKRRLSEGKAVLFRAIMSCTTPFWHRKANNTITPKN